VYVADVTVARMFYLVSLGLAVLLTLWAIVNVLFFGDQAGVSFPVSFLLWAVSGLPLLVAGLLIHGLRMRRTSMSMPAHVPDWKRR